MAGLTEPTLAAAALHRLAGLAATYAMPRLLLLIRQAERRIALGESIPRQELETLAQLSLAALEAAP
jgi:hypothetical protein